MNEFYDPEFAAYVDGRTIAVVGPAPSVGDQAAEVDAHDLVYRVSGHLGLPDGYGTRWDIEFVNSTSSGLARDGRFDELLSIPDWVVTKRNTRFKRPGIRQRRAELPVGKNANQVTAVLWDLAQYRPADVTVFGTTFYAAGPIYAPGYHNHPHPASQFAPGIRTHDQAAQRAIIRGIRDRTGWPSGDARFTGLLDLDDDAFRGLIEHWYQPRKTLREYDAAAQEATR